MWINLQWPAIALMHCVKTTVSFIVYQNQIWLELGSISAFKSGHNAQSKHNYIDSSLILLNTFYTVATGFVDLVLASLTALVLLVSWCGYRFYAGKINVNI